MDVVSSFLRANHERISLERYGIREPLSYVLVTPRFRASSHVVVLILTAHDGKLALVAKLPRLKFRASSIIREAEHLRLLRKHNRQIAELVPQVVACGTHRGWPLLLETALVGTPLDPVVVRRAPTHCCDRVLDWLSHLHSRDINRRHAFDWFDHHVDSPLTVFAESFPVSVSEAEVLKRLRAELTPLADVAMPVVFEHGDLSHPNILQLDNEKLGVIDWEVSDPYGVPLCDLCFFLAYVAFSRANALTSGNYIQAFHDAFLVRGAWARRPVLAYVRRLGLPSETLTPLFLLCWFRCVSRLLDRLVGPLQPGRQISNSVANWLRENRYYKLWKHAVEHASELSWIDD